MDPAYGVRMTPSLEQTSPLMRLTSYWRRHVHGGRSVFLVWLLPPALARHVPLTDKGRSLILVLRCVSQGAAASQNPDTPPELRDVLQGGVLIVKVRLPSHRRPSAVGDSAGWGLGPEDAVLRQLLAGNNDEAADAFTSEGACY